MSAAAAAAACGGRAPASLSWSAHLTGVTLKDRLRIAMILASYGGRRLRRLAGMPQRVLIGLATKTPDRLLIAPQDIRTSDPTIAADITSGYFAFGGKIVNAHGRSPFLVEPVAETDDGSLWKRQLAGFGWLRHLRAADSPTAPQRGRELILGFIAAHAKPSEGPAWEPAVAGRRMLAWLSQSPVVLDGADRGFYIGFMQALNVGRAHLERQMAGGLGGKDRLLSALALAEYGLCVQGAAGLQRRGSQALAGAIDAQVLQDGGHISRNPQAVIDLLLDLLPLRQAYAARGIQAPQQVLNAIDRMMPMLRLFRHGDGTLALFNGMGVTAPDLVATILAYDDARARPLANAPYAGYQRLEAGRTIVIIDSGAKPPPGFSGQAHAGCLSFELSFGAQRIVVNCGAPEGYRPAIRESARMTAAHSTLVVDDTSSCRFAAGQSLKRWLGDEVLAGPSMVAVKRTQGAGAGVAMSHDGYVARVGLLHRRNLMLAQDGGRIDGIDRIEAASRPVGPVPYALRFHLHPSVRVVPTDGASQIALEMPDGESWLFEADTPAMVEASVLFAAAGGPRPTTQIKVAANSGVRQDIRWSFRRL